jgi:DNA-binding transcriptional regulator YiaG
VSRRRGVDVGTKGAGSRIRSPSASGRKKSKAAELARCRALVASGAARAARIGAGLSLAEMGESVGVAHVTILRWERGDRIPHGAPALRYLAVIDELMSR